MIHKLLNYFETMNSAMHSGSSMAHSVNIRPHRNQPPAASYKAILRHKKQNKTSQTSNPQLQPKANAKKLLSLKNNL